MSKKRILTGDRPSGKLHLGHYIGSLKERLRLQEEYHCAFLIADLHSLLTQNSPEEIEQYKKNTHDIVLDYLACGIHPDNNIIYLQSYVEEVLSLMFYLSPLVSKNRIERIPSLKEMRRNAQMTELSLGLLSYPLLQTADILIFQAHLVPIGKDNEAHLELCQEITHRFNRLYGEFFPIPQAWISHNKTLVGLDNKAKMSKSLNNAIYLSDDSQTVRKKVFSMYTDPNRISADICGTVEGNPVFIYHEHFNQNKAELDDMKERYRLGKISDMEVKEKLFFSLEKFLEPIREKRLSYQKEKGLIEYILYTGTLNMKKKAKEILDRVQTQMGLKSHWNRLRRQAEYYQKLSNQKESKP